MVWTEVKSWVTVTTLGFVRIDLELITRLEDNSSNMMYCVKFEDHKGYNMCFYTLERAREYVSDLVYSENEK